MSKKNPEFAQKESSSHAVYLSVNFLKAKSQT